jgi:hypothetical protein
VRSKIIAIVVVTVGVLLLIFQIVLSTQSLVDEEQDLNQQSFSYKDKKPGGCYVLYTSLSKLFATEIKPKVVTKPFATSFKKDGTLNGAYSLYVLVSDYLFATTDDVNAMVRYAKQGNELFLAVNNPDSALMSTMRVAIDHEFKNPRPASIQHYVNPALAPDTAFFRKGIYEGHYFTEYDTSMTTILGTDEQHRPNFIRVNAGDGYIYLSLNPSALTNYFLLNGKNMLSLRNEFSYTDYTVQNVYWDEYYKYERYKRAEGDFSEWQVLKRYPAMRWAVWLAVLLLIIYIVFEGKRRQRIIPDKPQITNNSLEFVNALGQLYYQQHDNVNLGRKISQQWLEYIRTRFYMNTNYLNDTFVNTLAHKSGVPLENVREILDSIHHIQLANQVSDEFLTTFYKNIQAFYLNTK